MIFNYAEFSEQPRLVQQFILKDTFKELTTGEKQLHSLQTILNQNRMLAVGCRMLGRGGVTINGKIFTGKDIADVYVNSVLNYGFSYYPLTGDWTKTDVKQLVLFVKNSNKYVPYARFAIDEVILSDTQPNDFNQHCTEADFLNGFKYKTILKISEVQITDLPKSFIGVKSGMDIYDCAFHGSSPNIFIL